MKFLFIFTWLWSSLTAAERVALVIGNDAYEHTEKLDNCVNDARVAAGVLNGAWFTVVAEIATAEGIYDKLTEFKRQAADCKAGLL